MYVYGTARGNVVSVFSTEEINRLYFRRHDTQLKDTLHNDTQHNNKKHYTRHNGTWYSILLCWVLQISPLCWMSLCWMSLCWVLWHLLLLLDWTAEFPWHIQPNRLGPYLFVLGRSHCACWTWSTGGSWWIWCARHERDWYRRANEQDRTGQEMSLAGWDCFWKSYWNTVLEQQTGVGDIIPSSNSWYFLSSHGHYRSNIIYKITMFNVIHIIEYHSFSWKSH